MASGNATLVCLYFQESAGGNLRLQFVDVAAATDISSSPDPRLAADTISASDLPLDGPGNPTNWSVASTMDDNQGRPENGHVDLWTATAAPPPGSNLADSPNLKPAAVILFSAASDTSPESGYTPQRFGIHPFALSPIHQLDTALPPILIFHGNADPTVPYAQVVALNEKLKADGNR